MSNCKKTSWSVTVTYKDLQNPDKDLNIDHRSVRAHPLQLISPGIPVITILWQVFQPDASRDHRMFQFQHVAAARCMFQPVGRQLGQ